MLDFLINHSIHLIGLLAIIIIAVSEYKKYLKRNNLTPSEFRSLIQTRTNELGKMLLIKLVVSILVSIVISVVSFRELWMNDTFHIVFLANVLSRPTYNYLKRIFG